ncbi:succinate dehydrogenase, cytochrome b556 subunit [Gluconacetobacter diazotrophicus]|uniref:Succinate dehydrogenase cytochrome b556 subunit n=1 Tax=Gluconacetobacter diazotrophicus (strain ATCC 49037 / DSM 5601 / CCUG 37298 / CIP 103539 / LMG 7603 / PAl5) TaxID=272568 RepID=A9HFE2_GLUDA|nr:succinate dehydrogenase, cytochrome b556 subunit [Gluconacetobacter diazotrophicus]CAP55349.1 putative Succinate dehydrogenase cytochrome b556 subunit [Gluconacetobacter diazotrophicus PA1 5]
MQDVRDALYIGHRSDGTLTRRPMSPHLQVYRFRLSMFLSIANRAAGVAAAAGSVLGVCWLNAAAKGPESFKKVQKVTRNPLGKLALVGWTLSLVYHFVAGLRHLSWDAGYRFEKKEINEDGPIAVGVTVGTTLALVATIFGLAACRSRKKKAS